MTSPVKNEFTLKSLVERKFSQANNEAVKEVLIGPSSFGSCLSKWLLNSPLIKDIKSIPSEAKLSPGRLGYYTGGYTVLKHSKWKGVDAIQIELPISVRTVSTERREAMVFALAWGIQQFHVMHYQSKSVNGDTLLPEEDITKDLNENRPVVKVPLCQVKWSWKDKKLIRLC